MMELATYTELEIAHRLMTAYTQKCCSLHGHRYQVEITVTAQKFNDDGMIVDFKKLKEVVKTVLDDQWDHGSCFNVSDPLGKAVKASGSERVHIINANPTLEWMVRQWALDLQMALDAECPGVVVSMLKASETARNTVTWRCNHLPWEISQPADEEKTPICVEKDERGWRSAMDSAAVAVPAPTPTAGLEEGETDGKCLVDTEVDPDAVPYLVAYSDNHTIGSTVVRSSLKAQALYDFCTGAVQPLAGKKDAVVVIGITRLPG